MPDIQENRMGTQKMLPLILSMSLPAIFSFIVQALYNVVDSLFVARISDDALSAVSLAFPVQQLLTAFTVGTAVGINSLISRKLGEKNQEDANKAASNGLFVMASTWLILSLLGLLLLPTYFHLFTEGSPEIQAYSLTYTRIVLFTSIGVFMETGINKILQATGEMILPMFAMLVGTVTNIILDSIMIFGYFGCPKMGVAGAAWATVIGQWAAMIFNIFVLLLKKHDVEIRFKSFKPDKAIIRMIYAVGFPSILMQSISSVMISFLNLILVTFSQTAVSVLGVYYKLQSFVFMPVFGMNNGTMPIMGYSFGARNKQRYWQCLSIGSIMAFIYMSVGCIIFQLFPGELLSIFNPNLLEIGIPALKTASLAFPMASMSVMLSSAFQSAGLGFNSFILSFTRQLLVIIPLAWFLSRFGLSYVWYAFPIAEIVCLILGMMLYRRFYKNTLCHF